jgi:hypothetical protein
MVVNHIVVREDEMAFLRNSIEAAEQFCARSPIPAAAHDFDIRSELVEKGRDHILALFPLREGRDGDQYLVRNMTAAQERLNRRAYPVDAARQCRHADECWDAPGAAYAHPLNLIIRVSLRQGQSQVKTNLQRNGSGMTRIAAPPRRSVQSAPPDAFVWPLINSRSLSAFPSRQRLTGWCASSATRRMLLTGGQPKRCSQTAVQGHHFITAAQPLFGLGACATTC